MSYHTAKRRACVLQTGLWGARKNLEKNGKAGTVSWLRLPEGAVDQMEVWKMREALC